MLVGLLLLGRLLYLAFWCPYSLVEDEANYWTWAQHLDWSYYTKGPGVAWTIWLTTQIFGNTEFGVRVAAPCFMAVGGFASAALAYSISRKVSAAIVATLAFSLAPAFLVLGVIHTIDSGFAALWLVAACLAWKGLREAKAWPLAACGFVIGIAVLFKYTALLLLPGLLMFAWLHRGALFAHARRGPVLLGIVLGAILLCVAVAPVAIWNAREGWPTIAHLLGHLGVAGGDVQPNQGGAAGGYRYNPLWTLTFFATLFALAGPAFVVACAFLPRVLRAGVLRRAPSTDGDNLRMGVWFCVLCGLPVLVFYLLVSLIAEPEGNWSIAGFLTFFPLCGVAYAQARDRFAPAASLLRLGPSRKAAGHAKPGRTWQEHVVFAHVILGSLLMLFLLRADLASHVPGLAKVVPTGRFTGAATIGTHADELVAQLRSETGQEPFVMATHYGRTALLTFYMQQHPNVFCVSSLTGGRRTSWDFWESTIVAGNTSLLGRPALIVGGTEELWLQHFAAVRNIGALRGDPKRGRHAFLATGFRGLPLPSSSAIAPSQQPPLEQPQTQPKGLTP